MPLLQAYTISFIDNTCKKICIDFADPTASEYELSELVRFFKKYKKETFIDHKENNVNFIVIRWERWVEFLLKLGFQNTANAFCDILHTLEQNYEISPEEWVEQIRQAKVVRHPEKEKSKIEDKREGREYEAMKRKEIYRLRKKRENMSADIEVNIRKFLGS